MYASISAICSGVICFWVCCAEAIVTSANTAAAANAVRTSLQLIGPPPLRCFERLVLEQSISGSRRSGESAHIILCVVGDDRLRQIACLSGRENARRPRGSGELLVGARNSLLQEAGGQRPPVAADRGDLQE